MPKIYRKPCDWCKTPYEGYGARYCSMDCHNAARRAEFAKKKAGPPPSEEDFRKKGNRKKPPKPQDPTFEQSDDIHGSVTFVGERVRSIPQLLEACKVDLTIWEIRDAVVETYEGFRKDKRVNIRWTEGIMDGYVDDSGKLATETLYLVKVWLRKKLVHFIPQPVVLKVTRPKLPKSAPETHQTIHFSDAHIPYHDPRAINILYQVIDFVRPRGLYDQGDTLDCEEISRFLKDPYNRTPLNEEIEMGALHLGTVTSIAPEGADLRWFEGNHEHRLQKQIWSMADDRRAGEVLQLPGLKENLEWRKLLGLESMGWATTPYPQHHLLHDRLILKHGETVRQYSAWTARAEQEKYAKGGLSGHTHRQAAYFRRDHNGQHAWFELGMLGRIRDDYTEHPNWQQGFAVVTWSKDRKRFGVELVHIHEGVAYFRGRRFAGDAKSLGGLSR